MPMILLQDKCPGAVSAANSSIMAFAKMGHQHCRKVDSSIRQTFTIIAVEYFRKWIEAKPLTNVSSAIIKKFFSQNIICRYRVPRHITVDDAKYFDNAMFKELCKQISMKVAFASVYQTQSNGAVEKANCLIFQAMKKITEGEKKQKWTEVMPTTVWSHNTTVCRPTKFTPFRLIYGAEAMLPEEIKHQRLRATTESTSCPSEVEEKDLLE
jgi:hypothetical protein